MGSNAQAPQAQELPSQRVMDKLHARTLFFFVLTKGFLQLRVFSLIYLGYEVVGSILIQCGSSWPHLSDYIEGNYNCNVRVSLLAFKK